VLTDHQKRLTLLLRNVVLSAKNHRVLVGIRYKAPPERALLFSNLVELRNVNEFELCEYTAPPSP